MRIDESWLEWVSRSRNDVMTALLSTKKTGFCTCLRIAHWMASSKAAISASYDEPAGHHHDISCHFVSW